MKKTLLALTLVLALGIGSMVVFAETTRPETRFQGWHHESMTEQERTEWFNERNEYRNEHRQEELKQALKDGRITEAEAKEWEEHFKYMDEFHEKNGNIGGGCGRNSGIMRSNNHSGMMRGNRF